MNIDLGRRSQYQESELDVTERQYRSRFQPNYREEVNVTVDAPRSQPSVHQEYRDTEETVDAPRFSDKMGYYDEDGKLPSTRTA